MRRPLRCAVLLGTALAGFSCAGLPSSNASGDRPADPSGLACPRDAHVESRSDEFGQVVVCEDEDGKPEGYEVRFDTDGSLHTISVVQEDGIRRTYISWRRPGGGIVRFEPKDEPGTGVWTEWTNAGQLLSEIESKDGAMQGTAVWYYPDGQKRMQGQYENDIMTGLWQQWYPSARLQSECEWSDGQQHGVCRVWDPGGTLRVEGHYDHGAQAEGWKFWDSNGNPVRSPADLPPRP